MKRSRQMTRKSWMGACVLAIAVGGCWHEVENHNLQRPASTLGAAGDSMNAPLWVPKYIVVATDGDGNVNLYGDDGAGKTQDYGAIAVQSGAGPLPLGDVFIHQNHAFVLIPSGLQDASGNPTGGGVAIVDLVKALANITDSSALEIVPLVSNLTPKPTRITHAVANPGGEYLWITNAGPEGDAVSDSVFRFNWNVVDTVDGDGTGYMDDVYKDAVEVRLGNGDKRGARSIPVEGQVQAPLRYAFYDAGDQTLSILNDDHMDPAFMDLVKTIDLNSSGLGNVPGGIAYSPVSGKFYVGIASGLDHALTIVNSADYAVSQIPAGMAAGQIPAGGAVHASADGAHVYVLGYKENASTAVPVNRGYLSILDATNDAVAQIIELGDLNASDLSVAKIDQDGTQKTKIFLASTPAGAEANVIRAITLDPVTGVMEGGSMVHSISVGAGHAQRALVLTPDSLRGYVPTAATAVRHRVRTVRRSASSIRQPKLRQECFPQRA